MFAYYNYSIDLALIFIVSEKYKKSRLGNPVIANVKRNRENNVFTPKKGTKLGLHLFKVQYIIDEVNELMESR